MKKGVFLLTIGDEILDGRILNTNAQYFGEELRKVGVAVSEVRVVSDELGAIVAALKDAAHYPVVVVSGGLGPTNDDRTAEGAAVAFAKPLRATRQSLEHVRSRYLARKRKVNKIRLRQALLPKGARLLQNPTGIAPGFSIESEDSRLFFFPGVPTECRPMFLRDVIPFAIKRARTRRCLRREFWRTMGVTEGDLYEKLQHWMDPLERKYPGSLNFGVHIAFPGVDITLEVWESEGKKPSRNEIDRAVAGITRALGIHVYSRQRESLVEVVIKMLRERGLRLATAESCTGGWVGKALTDISGSSDVYWGGVISYANEAKEKFLGVKPATLRRVGAVNEQCASEMAEGIMLKSGADIGLSLTGISGPGGGSKDKPVGTLYVGIANVHGTEILHRVLGAGRLSREQNRTFSVHFALDSLRQQLLRSFSTRKK